MCMHVCTFVLYRDEGRNYSDKSASTVGSVKLLLCHLAFPSISLTHWDTKCSKFWVWDKSWCLYTRVFIYIHACECVCRGGGGGGCKMTGIFECCVINLPYMCDSFWLTVSCNAWSKSIGILYMECQCIVASHHINISFPGLLVWYVHHISCLVLK